jgi:tRNA pseudouridine32 synthase/23S rRNA pseudouridine746 synthase
VLEFLQARFDKVPPAQWEQRLASGDVIDDQGAHVHPQQPLQPGQRLYYFRSLPTETPIPFEATVLWQDEHLLVIDKPHFLPVLPSGKYVQETVLVRLKRATGMEELSPLHRIDRDTAGLVLFSLQRASRAAYQELFRTRQMHKTYEAIAPWNPALPLPVARESRIAPAEHFMQQREVPGTPNSLTHVSVIEVSAPLARYRLHPTTGLRHQLRVHMAALGLPLVNDGMYPVLTPEGAPDFTRPLQLLARSLSFTDPLTGEDREFHSQRSLRSLLELAAVAC